MIALRVRIKQHRPPDIMVRQWNHWVAGAFHAAGEYWVKEFLPLHFTASAVQRYQYSARKRRYLERKRYARMLRDQKGHYFLPTKPPLPLVYSSDARDELTTRPLTAFNIRATATSNKTHVKVPLRISHPMKPQQFAELRATIRAEYETLARVIFEFMKQAIELDKTVKVEAFGGFRS